MKHDPVVRTLETDIACQKFYVETNKVYEIRTTNTDIIPNINKHFSALAEAHVIFYYPFHPMQRSSKSLLHH